MRLDPFPRWKPDDELKAWAIIMLTVVFVLGLFCASVALIG